MRNFIFFVHDLWTEYLNLGFLILGVLTFINCWDVTWAIRVQDIFTYAKLLALFIIIAAGGYQLCTGKYCYFQLTFFAISNTRKSIIAITHEVMCVFFYANAQIYSFLWPIISLSRRQEKVHDEIFKNFARFLNARRLFWYIIIIGSSPPQRSRSRTQQFSQYIYIRDRYRRTLQKNALFGIKIRQIIYIFKVTF